MMRRGVVLLEVMLAVAAVVLAATAGYALLDRIDHRLARSSEQLEASDLANSALALIESGIASPENLHGSLHGRVISLESVVAGELVRDPEYRLEIETEPTKWSGLVRVDVLVIGVDSDRVVSRASQVVPAAGVLR